LLKKVDSDLEVLLENDTIVIFDNYFEVCVPDLSCLVSLPSEDGMYDVIEGNFVTLADGSQIVHVYGDRCLLEGIAENQSDLFAQSFIDVYLSGDDSGGCSVLGVGALPLLALLGAGGGGGGDSGGGGGGEPPVMFTIEPIADVEIEEGWSEKIRDDGGRV
jgi:hypothetical protein